jgi:hypothetical protein
MEVKYLFLIMILASCSFETKSKKFDNNKTVTHIVKNINELKINFKLPSLIQKKGIRKEDCFYFDLQIPYLEFPELKQSEIVLESLDEDVIIIPFNQTRFILFVQPRIKNPIFGISVRLKPLENQNFVIENLKIESSKSFELFQRIFPIIE